MARINSVSSSGLPFGQFFLKLKTQILGSAIRYRSFSKSQISGFAVEYVCDEFNFYGLNFSPNLPVTISWVLEYGSNF